MYDDAALNGSIFSTMYPFNLLSVVCRVLVSCDGVFTFGCMFDDV